MPFLSAAVLVLLGAVLILVVVLAAVLVLVLIAVLITILVIHNTFLQVFLCGVPPL